MSVGTITTEAELAALPERTAVVDRMGDVGTVLGGMLRYPETTPQSFERAAKKYGPFHIVYSPPAPEPEPEWREGVAGTAVVGPKRREVRAYAVGKGAVIEAVGGGYAVWNADDVHDFVPDATAACAHGQTAEDLCNVMPDKIELDAMWTAWKSLTPAEQRGWTEGGEGKVPTPAKVSGRPVVTRAQVFDILYPDGILPSADMRESKIDALMALFGGAS